MFQTHIHHWLQQFDHEILIDFFQIITQFGGKTTFLILLSALLFLVNLNKGLIILQSVLIVILVTLGLKVAYNMPRPYHVDPGVLLWDKDFQEVQLPYGRNDATGFWRLILAGALFLGLGFLLNKLEHNFSLKTISFWPFIKSFSLLFSFIYGSLWITSKLIKH